MKSIIIVLSLIFSFNAFSDISFQHGNDYSHLTYEGSVLASCNTTSRSHYCSAYNLNPSMYTRLVSNESLDADRFEVTATHANGKTRTKKGKFSGTNSQSINLWIRTLFQRPLLAFGANIIDYKILKGETVVREGQFEVNVNTGRRTSCRRGFIRMFGNQCDNTALVCDEYFRRGYCN